MRKCEISGGKDFPEIWNKECSSDYGGICECCGRYACYNCMAKSNKGTWIGLCIECRRRLSRDEKIITNYHERKNQADEKKAKRIILDD